MYQIGGALVINRREGESAMKVTTVGLDLAKQVFSVHGVDEHGKAVLRRRVSRGKLLELFAHLPSSLVGMKACSGEHYRARELERLGHRVGTWPRASWCPIARARRTTATMPKRSVRR
jgi:transposase